MRLDKNNLNDRWIPYTIASCSAVILFVILTHLNILGNILGGIVSLASPVMLGLIIAYVMSPLVKFIQCKFLNNLKSKTLGKHIALCIAVCLVVLLVCLPLALLIPQLIDSISTFIKSLDGYSSSLQSWLDNLQKSSILEQINIDLTILKDNTQKMLTNLTSLVTDNSVKIINTSVSIGMGAFNFVISFILGIYFLLDSEKLKHSFKELLQLLMKETTYDKMFNFLQRCNKILTRYIGCTILDGVIVGIINLIFMLIMDMPYAILVSVIVGITNLAPTFGPIVGAAIGGFIILFANPMSALVFILFTLVLQTIDGYIIKPKLFGNTFGISSLLILVSIIIWGRILGIVGVLLAIPIAAILDYLYKEVLITKLKQKRFSTDRVDRAETVETVEMETDKPRE